LTKEIGKELGILIDAHIPKHLTSPPFMPPIFVGRQAELNTAHDRLLGGDNFLMLVNGQGGVGKTTFAAKYWARYEHEYAHLAFLYVENGITQALLSLAQVMGLKFTTEPIPHQLDLLVQAVTCLQKPCLLILDNANHEKDLLDNLHALRKCTNFHILLTSRLADLAYTAKYPLGTLDIAQARQLFKQHYPLLEATEAETRLFNDIYGAVAGNTLVLELMAKNLSNFNNVLKKRYSLQNLKDDLLQNLTRLSKSKAVQTEYQAKGTGIRNETPEAIILAMYDLTELSEAETALLSVLSVLPAENIEFATLEQLLGEDDLDQTLLSLAQKGWIEQTKTAFKTSPVVQGITRHQNQTRLWTDCEKMIDFLLEKLAYQGTHITGSTYEYAALYSYYAESISQYFEPHTDIAILLERIGEFYKITGNLTKALVLYERQNQIGKTLVAQQPQNPAYKNSLAISYEKLGLTHQDLGKTQEALQFFEMETKLFEELYDAFPTNETYKNSLAISYSRLGETHRDVGKTQEALQFFEKYNQLEKELYDAFPANMEYKNGLAISYERLGKTQASVGKTQEALQFFEKDAQLTKELYDAFPANVAYKNNLAISYSRLGNTHKDLGNTQKALQFFEKYNQLEKELHDAFPANVDFKNGLAISYLKLGGIQEELKDIPKAKQYYAQGHQLYQALVRDFPQYPAFQKNLRWVEARL
jgi:tetratricopeptide (TPR) repeat protein